MTVHFSLKYNTVWGEQLIVRIGKRSFGMRYTGDGMWEAELSGYEIRKGQKYTYEVVRDAASVRKEWREHTFLPPEGVVRDLFIRDRWFARPANSALSKTVLSALGYRMPSWQNALADFVAAEFGSRS